MHVLLVGYEPEAVDFSDPALPPGLDAAKIQAGIAMTLDEMRGRGWTAESCLVRPDDQAAATVKQQLASASYDCLVIGAGIRAWTRHLHVFEAIINAAREAAPNMPIAFNTKPQDSAEAVERVLLLATGLTAAQRQPSSTTRPEKVEAEDGGCDRARKASV